MNYNIFKRARFAIICLSWSNILKNRKGGKNDGERNHYETEKSGATA